MKTAIKALTRVYLFLHGASTNIPSVSFEWESAKGIHEVTIQNVGRCGWGAAPGIDAENGFFTRVWSWPWDGGVYAWDASEVIRQTFMQCCMEVARRFSVPEHVLFGQEGKQALSIILADALDNKQAQKYAEKAVASKNFVVGEAELMIGDNLESMASVNAGDMADQYLKEREKKYRDWSEAEEEKKVRQVTADAVKAYALKKNLEGQVERLRKSRNEMYRISAWEEWEKLGQMIREIDSKIAELE